VDKVLKVIKILNYLLPLIDIIKKAGIIFKALKKTTDILVLLSHVILGRSIEFFDLKKYY
jgi:hypothetical protein